MLLALPSKLVSFLVSHKPVLIRTELRSVMGLSTASTDPPVRWVCSSGSADECTKLMEKAVGILSPSPGSLHKAFA